MQRFFCSRKTIIAAVTIAVFTVNFVLIMLWLPNNMSKSHYSANKHLLCVVFPYRDRWRELHNTTTMLKKFLEKQHINAYFIVINQTDNLRFNRAALINIGAIEAKILSCDYMALHDVDLVPLNPELNYSYPGRGCLMHITAGKYHPIARYDYQNYIGGVLLITLEDFTHVNGMSNEFWGWGLEDDEFFLRLREFGLADKIMRPTNLTTNRTNTFLHLHTKKRDYIRTQYRKKRKRGRDRRSGLNSVNFTLNRRHYLTIGSAEVRVLDVELHCRFEQHEFCTERYLKL